MKEWLPSSFARRCLSGHRVHRLDLVIAVDAGERRGRAQRVVTLEERAVAEAERRRASRSPACRWRPAGRRWPCSPSLAPRPKAALSASFRLSNENGRPRAIPIFANRARIASSAETAGANWRRKLRYAGKSVLKASSVNFGKSIFGDGGRRRLLQVCREGAGRVAVLHLDDVRHVRRAEQLRAIDRQAKLGLQREDLRDPLGASPSSRDRRTR